MKHQIPQIEGNWLYRDESSYRTFSQSVYMRDDNEPWPECTDVEKVTWNMDFSKDIDLSDWNPTDKGTTFLQNFLSYIADRLTDNGSGKTLTLSQAVYDAIKGTNGGYASTHTLGEIYGESLVLTPLEIELGITENTLYSTWLTTYFGENGINWNIETPN